MSGIRGWCLAALLMVCPGWVLAHDYRIAVGGYVFPPYLSMDENGRFQGATHDLLTRLNSVQDQFEFRLSVVTATSRYQTYHQQRFDLIFFESADWWVDSEDDIRFTPPIAYDRDLYVALSQADRDQRFFDRLHELRLIVSSGYHYGFADNEVDEEALRSRFNISFAPDHESSLLMLERGRGDVALVNESYLKSRSQHGEELPPMLIAEQPDREYRLAIGIRPDALVSPEWLFDCLNQMASNGDLARIEARWGIRFADL